MKNLKKPFMKAVALASIVVLALVGLSCITPKQEIETKTYEEFQMMIETGNIEKVYYNTGKAKISFEDIEGITFITDNPRYSDFKKDLLEKGIEVEEQKSAGLSNYTSLITPLIIFGFMFLMMNKMMKDDKEFASVKNKPDTTFKDVAGLKEVKEDLMGVVDFLSDSEKYVKAGAKLPKGVLLYGPPGTGKTLLARAVAGEAKANFICANGSDFSNKFVGVGGDRVRQLFKTAREQKPCIIFIDEIDAVGGSRDGGNTHSENRNTLNALLSEMDGYTISDGILVIAATNRLEDLDNALVRPGRFDNIFAVPLPSTTEERKEVIEVYTKDKKLDDEVDITALSKQMIGSSPAEIESVINEASIIAAKKNNGIIRKCDLDEAYIKKIMKGHVKDNKERDYEQLKLTAWHEAGHALVGALLGQDVSKVTILPTSSGAGGFTVFSPEKMGMFSKDELEGQVMSAYGGRAAEELLVGKDKITTGASADISRATEIIYGMVYQYGMWGHKEAPLLNYTKLQDKTDEAAAIMDEMAHNLYHKTVHILNENYDKLENLANALLEKETLSGSEILKIIM